MMADRQIKLAFLGWIALMLLIMGLALPWRDLAAWTGGALLIWSAG